MAKSKTTKKTKKRTPKKTTKAGKRSSKPTAPKPPPELPPSAAKIWRGFIGDLVKLERTRSADLLAFDVFCRERARWLILEREIGEKPIVNNGGVIKPHPGLSEARRARDAWLAQGQALGLVPGSPAKPVRSPGPDPKPPQTPMPGGSKAGPGGPGGAENESGEDEKGGWEAFADSEESGADYYDSNYPTARGCLSGQGTGSHLGLTSTTIKPICSPLALAKSRLLAATTTRCSLPLSRRTPATV